MKNERIRYRTAETDELVASGIRAFCLISGNLRAAQMAELFLGVLDQMAAVCMQPGPFLFVVSRAGLRRVI